MKRCGYKPFMLVCILCLSRSSLGMDPAIVGPFCVSTCIFTLWNLCHERRLSIIENDIEHQKKLLEIDDASITQIVQTQSALINTTNKNAKIDEQIAHNLVTLIKKLGIEVPYPTLSAPYKIQQKKTNKNYVYMDGMGTFEFTIIQPDPHGMKGLIEMAQPPIDNECQ